MARASTQPAAEAFPEPRIDDIVPAAALPGGEIELIGANLGPLPAGPSAALPFVVMDDLPAQVLMSRPGRLALRVPEDATTGMIEVHSAAGLSNTAPVRVARQLSDGLHPVTSPAVSRSGMIYATISGQRGKQTPVSVVRISPDGRGTPFVTGILNATGLAFSPEGDLFVTSRAEGNVYRIDEGGEPALYAEGMGVATGAVFDADGNLFVGDRSGTIFKINPGAPDLRLRHARTQRRGLSPGHRCRRHALRHRTHALLERCHLGHRAERRGPRLVPRAGAAAGPGAGPRRKRLPGRLPPWPPRPGARHAPRRGVAGRGRRQSGRRRIFSARHHHSGHQRSRL